MEWTTLPGWLTEILKQFPALVVVWISVTRVASYLEHRHERVVEDMRSQHTKSMDQLQQQHKLHTDDLSRAHDQHLKSKDEEIQRLVKMAEDVRKDRDRFLKRITPEDRE